MNETLTTEGGRTVLRMERTLAHPVEKVWRAVTRPAELAHWYPFPVAELDLQVGGKIRFTNQDGTTADGVVTEADRPRVFAFRQDAPAGMRYEGETEIRIELRPEEGGCLLVFTQVFHDRPAAASYASGWQVCLDALEATLDDRPVRLPEDNFPHLHESYVAAFGLAEGTAERDGDGWRVRFERQLTRPVEEVWRRLGGPSARVGAPAPGPYGTISGVEDRALLEAEDGRVRWELSQGTGHGARLTVTETGLADPAPALAAWRDRIEALARDLLP
ncbi:SRPBCC family protein [Microbispora sp. ATCC PTA-5024]|uniref:SRPBCC family protein n=1 Tax=Microbispora sp. ATCC PTA-5024 TaxID=316330 RepID=UPI0003DD8AC5|nr:SRPBCC family protein [Microbispora sp. ATCC PTA-5024]ETK34935.1 hypothetical protein MPTA5024_16650 [Microbispora sp. ATCC PTA-5024]